MQASEILPAFPIAALVAAILFLLSGFARRLRLVALVWSIAVLPTLAFITYRLWDHYVGPDTFAFWRFNLSPANMPVLLPLAVVAPLLLLASEGKDLSRGRDGIASALCCLAIAAAMAAILCDHFFLLAIAFAVTTLCLTGSAVLRKRGSGLPPAGLIPVAVSDLCLALGVLLIYVNDSGRGLFFPAAALDPMGRLAAPCGLLLAAALLRLGSFPFHRWMSLVSKGGKEVRLVHVLIDLVLGAYLLYMVTRVFFEWSGFWIWICFGAGVITLLATLYSLLRSVASLEMWGLLCTAAGAHLVISASAASQMSAVAVRFGVFAAVSILALVHMGAESGSFRTAGGTALRGLPPLAGFAWRWMEFQVLILAFASGSRILLIAALPLVFAGALIEGFLPVLWSPAETEKTPQFALHSTAVLLAVFLLALGLYPGSFTDLLMREYGIAINLPFAGWTSLGWAILICAVLAVIVLYLVHREKESARGPFLQGALPLVAGGPFPTFPTWKVLENRILAFAALALLFAFWAAALIYLGLK